jgi:anhydro-N-acetylmuramic acid kinase
MVIDGLVRVQSRGKRKWDEGGQLAGKGRLNERLLGDLMDHPYLRLSPPKSTGREMFGEEFAKDLWSHPGSH